MSGPMTAKQIFLATFEMADPAARAKFLAHACGDNHSLRREVEALLGAHHESDDLLDQPRIDARRVISEEPLVATVDVPFTEKPGSQIGPFKLLEQIGEGGMGIVYMAEQQRPVRRKVALKIIKPGMDTKQVIARFEAERQALAMMDHPNIAHVLDAGSTESQRPYFVMELVRGIPITAYCDKNKLDTRERLLLFISVCQAVQHAHTKGIIHRDLKPSNVLVTLHDGIPVPKIIDFGVAKATNQQLTERTLFTSFAQMIGTPLYMSPEQAEMSGLDVDTRSDIYSLGVLLYELLTGTTPFDRNRIHTAAYDEVRRIIREEEPDKPSTRVSSLGDSSVTVSAKRGTDPKKLKQLLRGELDWIVMKALEKDRTRRYETASSLVAEVTRYLNGETVEACPPSTTYRVRKFVQRHKTRVAVALGFMLFLLLSTAVSWGLYVNAHRAQRNFKEERDRALAAEQASALNLQQATTEKQRAESEKLRADSHARQLKQRLYDYNILKAAGANRDKQLLLSNKLLEDCLEEQRNWEWGYLRKLTGADRSVPLPAAGIIGGTLTRDGKHILLIDEQGTVRLVDLANGEQLWSADTKIAVPIGFALSPDGEVAAIAGMYPVPQKKSDPVSGILKVFETRTGKVKFEDSSPDEHISFPDISPDQQTMVVTRGSGPKGTGTLELRRLVDGVVIWSQPIQPFSGARYSPRGSVLFLIETESGIAQGASRLRCLDCSEGKEIWSIQRTTASMVEPTMDGTELIGGGPNHSLVIWDAKTGVTKRVIPGHSSDLAFFVQFSPDAKTVLTLGMSGQVTLWDWATKSVHKTYTLALNSRFQTQFTPDNKQLIYVSDRDHRLQFLAIDPPPTEMQLVGHASDVKDAAFRIGNEELISTAPDGTLRYWNTQSGQELKAIPLGAATFCLNYCAEARLLATGGADGVKLWDDANGKLLQHWKNIGNVWWVKLDRTGGRLAAVSELGEIKLWDTNGGRELHSSSINEPINGLALSPDGRRAVTLTCKGAEVIMWDFEANRRTTIRATKSSGLSRAVALAPDGTVVAAGVDDSIELWNPNTQQIRATLPGHGTRIHSLVFNSTGTRLFSGDGSGLIDVWNIETQERLLTIQAHKKSVESLALSSDDATLASCSGDGLIKLWETKDITPDTAERRRVVQQATTIVNQRFATTSSIRDALESIRNDKSIDEQVVPVALAIVNARGNIPNARRAYQVTMQTDANEVIKIRRGLDDARKSLIALLGIDVGIAGATSNQMSPSDWHSTVNGFVDPAYSAISLQELIGLLTPLVETQAARHEFAYIRGVARTHLRQWSEAERDLTLALSLVPDKSPLWHEYAYRLAFLRAYLGQWDQYASLCQKTLADFADTQDPKIAERTSKMCLFSSEVRVDAKQAGELADRAMNLKSNNPALVPYFQLAKGIADLRRENYAGAIESLESAGKGLKTNSYSSSRICLCAADLYLAIAYTRVDRRDDAKKAIAEATSIFAESPQPIKSQWNDWMNAKIVLSEAQAIVNVEP